MILIMFCCDVGPEQKLHTLKNEVIKLENVIRNSNCEATRTIDLTHLLNSTSHYEKSLKNELTKFLTSPVPAPKKEKIIIYVGHATTEG